ncbi:MAG: CinA family nicotinamide mononucleotide deamidase-related protein [Desulfotignum sp.]
MTAEILSTGDEVLLGDLVDTNSAFLCDRLKQMGIRVSQITVKGDDVAAVCATVEAISLRATLCLVSGGLGPTQDDITAMACAKAMGESLVLNSTALASMKTYFDRRGFELTPDNEKQAWLPASATVLENTHGTAPGFAFQLNQCWFFCMPGVPSEMKQMMETCVVPQIQTIQGTRTRLFIKRFTVFGLHESKVGVLLASFNDQFPEIRLGFRASFPTIEVKLVCDAGKDEKATQSVLERAGLWVGQQLGSKVVSDTGLSLQAEVGKLLAQQGQTLAVAESCTGGLISHLITQVPGSSQYFLLSAVTYANSAKIDVLGVKTDTLETFGAVHETTALEMAAGAKRVAGSDWSVSTTGVAGPGGGPTSKKVGTVCIGVAGPGGVAVSRKFEFRFDDRDKNKKIFAAMALELLRRYLTGERSA